MANPRVFIDGEAGTTGLQIRERLAGRTDIMEMIKFTDDKAWNSTRRVPQAGTYQTEQAKLEAADRRAILDPATWPGPAADFDPPVKKKVDCSKPENKNKAACKPSHGEANDDELDFVAADTLNPHCSARRTVTTMCPRSLV